MSDNPYRDLPSVDALASRVGSTLPRPIVTDLARAALDEARAGIGAGQAVDPLDTVLRMVRSAERAAGVGVVNATGVLLHTNLGRAPWSEAAIQRAAQAASGYENLEIDISTGERARRGSHVERLLRHLTGAEAAMVVNNNASALLIALAALAGGRAVPVARGELIEIGGSYRLPDVMTVSGARLVEVGTTNRTRAGDYRTAAQTHNCGALLKVHPSNYRVEGFTEEASVEDLAAIAADTGLPLIYDIGSGLLDETQPWVPGWLRGEPGARQGLTSGADLVTFSGDKLLGGPQAGILVGTADLVGRIRSHPLARALRVDGVTLAALAATLEAYLDGAPLAIPFWRYALAGDADLAPRVEAVAAAVHGVVEPGHSRVGAGSAPGIEIPTPVLRIRGRQDAYDCLLQGDRPVLARRDGGDLVIDLRAVDPGDDAVVLHALATCL